MPGSRTQRKNFSHSQQQIVEAEVADLGGMSSPMRTFAATAISTAMSSLRVPEQARAATLAHVSRPRLKQSVEDVLAAGEFLIFDFLLGDHWRIMGSAIMRNKVGASSGTRRPAEK
jgi:hypothetical protein